MFAALHRYDLAELYLKLKNCEKAEKVVKTALEQEKGEWIIFYGAAQSPVSRK